MQRRNNGRRASALVFLLGAMTVAAVVVSTLVGRQTGESAVATARELNAIADALALSGVELMEGIGSHAGGDQGPQFLDDRERVFTAGTPYEFVKLFGLPADATAVTYNQPMPYPPIDDVALEVDPRNDAPVVMDNDIRQPIYDAARMLANTTTNVVGSSPPAVLPNTAFRPRADDNDYNGPGVRDQGAYSVIKALEPDNGDTNPEVAWWGPKNRGGATYPTQTTFQGGDASQKVPPPSILFARDVAGPNGITYRGYIFCWYVRGTPLTEHYLLCSARVRRVYGAGGAEEIGPEEMVSHSQLR